MIETYKILSGKYDTNVVPQFKTTGIQATRGNDLRIFKTRFKYDLRKFYFTNRVVDAWNSLPNCIVMANSTNTFKHTQVRYRPILARPDYLRFSCTVSYREPRSDCSDLTILNTGYVKV